MKYSEEQIERARRRDIVELARELGMELKQRGRTVMTCCILHEEHTPSMQVGGRHNVAHCYACGGSLDTIALVMTRRGCSFHDAVGFIIRENEKLKVKNEKLIINNAQGAVNSERLIINNAKGAVNNERLKVKNEKIIINNEKLIMNNAQGGQSLFCRYYYFNPEFLEGMVSVDNSLSQCLLHVFPRYIVEWVTQVYKLGCYCTRSRCNNTAFPIIDREGYIRDLKIQHYDTDPGSPRFCHSDNGCYWLGAIMRKEGSREIRCEESKETGNEESRETGNIESKETGKEGRGLAEFTHEVLFGEHLLRRFPNRVVVLVESPKNAVVGACRYPDLVWVATGNKGMLKRPLLEVLRGREVLVIPDRDATEEWTEKIRQMQDIATFQMSSFCQCTEDGENRKMDIADLILARP